MAQILVRGLDSGTVDRLKNRARREGHSLQAECKLIIERAAKVDMDTARTMLEAFRHGLKGRKFADSAELLREDRER
jgi:plasmid stability protein